MSKMSPELVGSVAEAEAQVLHVPSPLLEEWFDFAQSLNGYAVAEELGVDLGALSERLWSDYRITGRWSGTWLELRMVLFHEARSVHMVDGLGEDAWFLAGISALLNDIAVAEDERLQGASEPTAGAPKVFRAAIGGHFGPSFDVEWVGGRLVYEAFGTGHEFGLPEELGAVKRFVRPTRQRWQRFWDVLERVGVWGWEPEYSLPVMDGTAWTMEFEAEGRVLRSRGSNAYPGAEGPEPSREFRRVCRAVHRLVGGLPFH